MRIPSFTLPTESQRLLLHACLSSDTDFEDFLRKWEDCQDLDLIDVGSLRLLPFLSRRIESLGTAARDRGRIKGVYLKNWFEQQTQQAEVREILSFLQEQGLQPIILKGYALAKIAYLGQAPTRPSADLDVLVDAPDLDSAVECLTVLGYQAPVQYSATDHNEGLKSMGLAHPQKRLEVDVHVRVVNFSADPQFHLRVRDRAVEMTIIDTRVLTLCPTDHLIHVLVHGAGANQVPSIRWIVDAAELINHTSIDWTLFIQEVSRCKLRKPILDQLIYLVCEFDLPIPPAVVEQIRRIPASLAGELMQFRASLRSRMHMRLARALYAEYLARPGTFDNRHFWLTYPVANIAILREVLLDYTRRRTRLQRAHIQKTQK